jgi:hypothetical protein
MPPPTTPPPRSEHTISLVLAIAAGILAAWLLAPWFHGLGAPHADGSPSSRHGPSAQYILTFMLGAFLTYATARALLQAIRK